MAHGALPCSHRSQSAFQMRTAQQHPVGGTVSLQQLHTLHRCHLLAATTRKRCHRHRKRCVHLQLACWPSPVQLEAVQPCLWRRQDLAHQPRSLCGQGLECMSNLNPQSLLAAW